MKTRDRPTACAAITLCCVGQYLSFPGDHAATDKKLSANRADRVL
jgi:hypothetical protein